MNNDYRTELNKYLQHADVRVTIRAVETGEVPLLTIDAPLSTDAVIALLLGGVRHFARLASVEPEVCLLARGVLQELASEFDHEMRVQSSGR
jgi:hypothetical protein